MKRLCFASLLIGVNPRDIGNKNKNSKKRSNRTYKKIDFFLKHLLTPFNCTCRKVTKKCQLVPFVTDAVPIIRNFCFLSNIFYRFYASNAKISFIQVIPNLLHLSLTPWYSVPFFFTKGLIPRWNLKLLYWNKISAAQDALTSRYHKHICIHTTYPLHHYVKSWFFGWVHSFWTFVS